MVGAGVSQHQMALLDEGLGKELAEVAKTDNGELKLCASLKLVVGMHFMVIWLCCVECLNIEPAMAPPHQ